nr:MAG TPA: hypothetical protein [Caudoviricetes sp.]DAS45075.1 MAG TPA: hypothetical protein [Caudoviricetes sp.]
MHKFSLIIAQLGLMSILFSDYVIIQVDFYDL